MIPSVLKVTAGNEASFTGTGYESSLSPTYQWFINCELTCESLSDSPGKISGQLTPNLTVFNVQEADEGDYMYAVAFRGRMANVTAQLLVCECQTSMHAFSTPISIYSRQLGCRKTY